MTDLALEADLRTHKRSVTKGDYEEGSVLFFQVLPTLDRAFMPTLPPALPPDFRRRQQTLLATMRYESMWASAVYIAISKIAALTWEMESDIPLRGKRAQQWLLHAGAGTMFGYTNFISMHLQAYLNSPFAVVEIERESKSWASRIRTIHHLDPTKCELTRDPEIPVIYEDDFGRQHEMKWHQVGIFSDMPSPTEAMNGTGICAAERAYRAIIKQSAIEQYLYEKVSGQRPLAIHIVQGIHQNMLGELVDTSRADAQRRNLTTYHGAAILGIPTDTPITVVTIPLAELPDGFNRKEEWDLSLLTYANAIGLDPQDLQPLTGQPLGSGAQSQVLDNKSKGRGLAMWRQNFLHFLNELCLDDKTQMAFIEKDLRDEGVAATNAKLRAETRAGQIASGEINPLEARNLAVDAGDLPTEFLIEDVTSGSTITDTEKPDLEAAEVEDGQENRETQLETGESDNVQVQADR